MLSLEQSLVNPYPASRDTTLQDDNLNLFSFLALLFMYFQILSTDLRVYLYR